MEKQKVQENVIHSILELYGLDAPLSQQKEYVNYNGENGDNLVKIILSVVLENGKHVVMKILREQEDLLKDREKIEKQSAFSEFLRQNGIDTPRRYMTNGRYCNEYVFNNLACNVTVEDWCGEEITEINAEIAYKIGELMARIHTISLKNKCKIGCGTLFSAAYWNDVDVFPQFCKLAKNENLNQTVVEQIIKLHDQKLQAIRNVWDSLPTAAVQGDMSINNLVDKDGLAIFDYNNAGDEVLISDLVMEGLLTAYEMDLPDGSDESCREQLFPAMLNGYLSIRKLSETEAYAAWDVYTLYHSLWFTRVVYNDNSLEKLIAKQNYAAANQLLLQMLADISQSYDGRFRK